MSRLLLVGIQVHLVSSKMHRTSTVGEKCHSNVVHIGHPHGSDRWGPRSCVAGNELTMVYHETRQHCPAVNPRIISA